MQDTNGQVLHADFSHAVSERNTRHEGVPNDSTEHFQQTPEVDPDASLVARVRGGDKRAFDLLVGKYQTSIARLVAKYIKDPDQVNDVVQEAFIRAFKGIHKFRQDSQFYTWLYRIAVNSAYNQMRSVQRWQGMLDIDDEYHSAEVSDVIRFEGPDADRHNEDLKHAISRAVSRLPIALKTALLLRELEGMSYEQIAEVVGCKVGTVKSRISRAREFVMLRTQSLYQDDSQTTRETVMV